MTQVMWKIALALLFLLLSVQGHEQADSTAEIRTASVSDIQQVAGFARICGRADNAVSEENLAVVKASKGDPVALISKAMDAALADRKICISYLSGIIDGWQEGHEHGVDAMMFPNGIPDSDHYKKALSSLSAEQLRTAKAGMNADPLCLPEHITTGETLNVVVKYIRTQIGKNSWMGIAPTARMVHPALKATFRCPNEQGK